MLAETPLGSMHGCWKLSKLWIEPPNLRLLFLLLLIFGLLGGLATTADVEEFLFQAYVMTGMEVAAVIEVYTPFVLMELFVLEVLTSYRSCGLRLLIYSFVQMTLDLVAVLVIYLVFLAVEFDMVLEIPLEFLVVFVI